MDKTVISNNDEWCSESERFFKTRQQLSLLLNYYKLQFDECESVIIDSY